MLVKECSGTVKMEKWKSDGETVWWKSDSGKVRWNSKTVFVEQCGEQWNSAGSTVWWNSETVLVEQCDSGAVIVEQ